MYHRYDTLIKFVIETNDHDEDDGPLNVASSSAPTDPPGRHSTGPNTLADWIDPRGLVNDIRGADGIVLNFDGNIHAEDCDGHYVHPSQYNLVFEDGVWVMADGTLHL
jgi:hypothetical protein